MDAGHKPDSTAVAYVKSLQTLKAREIFDPETPKHHRIVSSALKRPKVRTVITYPNGRSLTLIASAPLENSGEAFLRAGNRVLLVTDSMINRIAPDVRTFFDPAEIKNREINW